MTSTYPLNEQFEEVIDRIYPGDDTGRLAIGAVGVSLAAREQLADPATPYTTRIQQLRDKLEGWVRLYADELEEFDGEYDILRLKSEARSVLMVLRELHRFFPDVVK